MIQSFLTHSIELSTIAAIGFFFLQFISGIMKKRSRIAPGQLSLFSDAELLSQLYTEALQDDGAWLLEIQQPEPIAFIPNPDPSPVATAEDAALVEQFSQFIAEYWANRPIANVVPFVRPVRQQDQAIDWASLAPIELRKACQQRSIKWRNAHGKNKHMSKAEMVSALSLTVAA